MIITRFEPDPPYPERIRSEADEFGLTRSAGLHLSQIIKDIEITIRAKDEWCSPEELAFFGAGGFLWERVFAKCHAEAIAGGELYRPGEYELDGIIGSPDLIRVNDEGEVIVVETKHPWKSVNKFDFQFEKYFWYWIVQIRGYCKMVGTNIAEVHAFFVNGNYRPPVPETRSVRIDFDDEEIDGNWKMITGHARDKGWL